MVFGASTDVYDWRDIYREWIAEIRRVLSSDDDDGNSVVAVQAVPGFDQTFSAAELRELRPRTWLGDDLINKYLARFWRRNLDDSQRCRSIYVDSQLLRPQIADPQGRLRRALQRQAFLGMTFPRHDPDTIRTRMTRVERCFVVLNQSEEHWVVLLMHVQQRRIYFFDSLDLNYHQSDVARVVGRLFWQVLDEACGREYVEDWTYHAVQRRIRQPNSYDCGVCCLQTVAFFAPLDSNTTEWPAGLPESRSDAWNSEHERYRLLSAFHD